MIKVECSAICGTDLRIYNGVPSQPNMVFPAVMGHEMADTVVAVGDQVSRGRIGQRVALETHAHCGECYLCKTSNKHVCLNRSTLKKYHGCFAEYKLTTENMLYVLPDNILFEEAAQYEPGGVAMYAMEESHMNPGDIVVIYGCGPIGLIAMQIFKAYGAGTVIGIGRNEFRLNMAKKYADVVINGVKEPVLDIVREIAQAHGGADVIIETTAAASIYETMLQMARPEAHIIIVGFPGEVPIHIGKYIGSKGLNIKGNYGRKLWSSWEKLNDLVSSKRIDLLDIVTHRFTLEQYEEAFATRMKDSGKVLFVHNQ